VVARHACREGLPGPQPDPLPMAGYREGRRPPWPSSRRPPTGSAASPWCSCRTALLLTSPTCTSSPCNIGLRAPAQAPFYDLIVIGAGPAASPRPCTAPPKACARRLSSARCREARPGRRLAHRELPGVPERHQRRRSRPTCVTQARRLGAEILGPRGHEHPCRGLVQDRRLR
jgi:hypothetical protein